MKNNVVATLARHQLKTFRVNYAPEYRNFITNHVVVDFSHPLHETQKRRQAERKKEGLWWHATTGLDLNKSSCVRAWARRRLRNAIKDELKERGYDERGMFVDLQAIRDRPDLMNVLRAGKTLNLTGSLRLHVQSPLIPAKYAEVRKETGFVIEAVVQAMKDGVDGHASLKQTKKRPERKPSSFSAKRPHPGWTHGQYSKQRVV